MGKQLTSGGCLSPVLYNATAWLTGQGTECAGNTAGKVVAVRRLRGPYAAVHNLCGQTGQRIHVSTRSCARRAGRAKRDVEYGHFLVCTVLAFAAPGVSGGELLDGKSWLPGITVPDSPYRFRFREADNSSAFAALAAGQLMPAEATGWLAENPEALGNLAGALWNQHPAMPLIRSLMKQAAEKTESPLMERKPAEILGSYAGEIPVNTALSNEGALRFYLQICYLNKQL